MSFRVQLSLLKNAKKEDFLGEMIGDFPCLLLSEVYRCLMVNSDIFRTSLKNIGQTTGLLLIIVLNLIFLNRLFLSFILLIKKFLN